MTSGKSETQATQGTQITAAGHRTGRLFIVSAPSGAGKTTLCDMVRSYYDELAYSVSYTTRPPRSGERHGHDYFFITVAAFENGISKGRWAEWAEVHDNYYGSSARWIERTLADGRSILMDIDLQGARQMLERFPKAVTIFIMPPSMAVLEQRLVGRGTDKRETIALRLANAKAEIAQSDICRHVLVNDDLEQAKKALIGLIGGYIGSQA